MHSPFQRSKSDSVNYCLTFQRLKFRFRWEITEKKLIEWNLGEFVTHTLHIIIISHANLVAALLAEPFSPVHLTVPLTAFGWDALEMFIQKWQHNWLYIFRNFRFKTPNKSSSRCTALSIIHANKRNDTIYAPKYQHLHLFCLLLVNCYTLFSVLLRFSSLQPNYFAFSVHKRENFPPKSHEWRMD